MTGNLLSSPTAYGDSDSHATHEIHNVILMFDRGPVHARFGIALNSRPVARRRANYIQELIHRLDVNSDQVLSREEANQSHLLRRKLSAGAERFLAKMKLNAKQKLSTEEVDALIKQVAGQPIIFRQNDEASTSDDFIFDLLDADSSGAIDESEMTGAAETLADRDTDEDDCIGFDEVQPPPVQQVDPNLVALGIVQQPEEMSHAVFSNLMRPADDRLLPSRMVRKYDYSGNGKLSPQELRWGAERIQTIDANQDGELSRSELARISETPLDIDLLVDVAPADETRPEFKLRQCAGQRLDDSSRPGIVSLRLNSATLTISYRHVDPVPEALGNARRKFNALDADMNGYLDQPEIQGETLLQRGLFDRMDADGDDKLFVEEMDDYVRERAEVKGMSCRVSIFDTGSGFFQAMDHNNDGRISVRELRSAESSLASLVADDQPGVSQNEPARRFHIEFARGSYSLFGPNEQIDRQTISFNTEVAAGPAWFVGSDRNNDGDLTWMEFLGHREDFHFLDKDGDGLIDPVEAERAELLRTN